MSALSVANPAWVFRSLPGPTGRGSCLVFVCYLDDSDNDVGPVASIAGYSAIKPAWEAFEREVEPFLSDRGIEVLHAMQFHHKRGPFEGWGGAQKLEFVDQLFSIAKRYVVAGISASVSKADFRDILRKEKSLQNMSPLGIAFGAALAAFLTKIDLPDAAFPVSFVVEGGHRNNPNIEKYYHWLRNNRNFPDGVLGSLSFVEKRDCRAIQLADFLAFHGRRAAEVWDRTGYPSDLPSDPVLVTMMDKVPHRFERMRGMPDWNSAEDMTKALFLTPGNRGLG